MNLKLTILKKIKASHWRINMILFKNVQKQENDTLFSDT